jgi:hypothetical protein
MVAIQLEFDIENKCDVERKIDYMEKHIAALDNSLTSVRKRLFAEVNQLRKMCDKLNRENHDLRYKIVGEKIEWNYESDEVLFEVVEWPF